MLNSMRDIACEISLLINKGSSGILNPEEVCVPEKKLSNNKEGSNKRSLNQNQLNGLLNRLHERGKKIDEKLESKKFMKYQEEGNKFIGNPQILEKSKKIAEKKGYIAIHKKERLAKIFGEREQKLKELKEELDKKKAQREEEEQRGIQNAINHRESSSLLNFGPLKFDVETFKRDYEVKMNHYESRRKEFEEERNRKGEGNSYAPVIDKKSIMMATRDNQRNLRVEDRLMKTIDEKEIKVCKLTDQMTPSFTPKTNKKIYFTDSNFSSTKTLHK